PSGCGKTTLMRLLSGFERPDTGQIFINGKDVTNVPPEQRHVNMVFQSYALFPHMTVFENVAFGLRCKHLPETEIQSRVTQALNMVKLEAFSKRKPQQLSGGQQQRVAIARAVVNRPLVLLLDEPLSALDYNLRKEMQIELKDLQRKLGITFVFVTHDQEEALSMSERVAVMNQGMIEQIGTPRDVYEEPQNLFVADFIGEANIFTTRVETVANSHLIAKIEDQVFTFPNKKQFKPGQTIHVVVRPEDIEVWGQAEVSKTPDMLPGIVEQAIYKGSTVDLMVRLPSNKLIAATEFFDEDDEKLEYNLGEKVWLQWVVGWEVLIGNET
ncbi:MAG: spermidine/putrescine ABC transporter ATP-binding protein PotA, partial [Gammaproteobacteria bacterium]